MNIKVLFGIIFPIFALTKITKSNFVPQTYCENEIEAFNSFDDLEFEPWRIKKGFISFVGHPNVEELLYEIKNVIKCNYRIIEVLKNLGIVIHTELFDDYGYKDEDNGYCDPVFVPFKIKYLNDTEMPENEFMSTNHSVVYNIEYGKFVVIFTCYSNPETTYYYTGAMILIDENIDVDFVRVKLLKKLPFRLNFYWSFKYIIEGQCLCEY
ncbi:unnamed protein product [Chironomus riparius]|uniref:Uncharacterized protein n=1 Tax=Chironomus riparius TaxID=315576 RepID=A0A9P0NP53_9DIPT|nr:unnamed protein product [Chironomus riparius]